MSATGRLWRRAPAWRLCLISSVMLTMLAALFPPPLPQWAHRVLLPHAGQPPSTSTAHFAMPEQMQPNRHGMAELPPLGAGRTGIVAFAGRQVALPKGSWQALMISRSGAPAFLQSTLLARIEGGQPTGLLYLIGPDPLAHATGPLALPEPCVDTKAIAVENTPDMGTHDLTRHECWNLSVSHLLDIEAGKTLQEPLKSGVGRLRNEVVSISKYWIATTFFRSDTTGWLLTTFQFPDRRAGSASDRVAFESWMRRYAVAFHQGYSGKLSAAMLTPAVITTPPP